MNEAEKKLSVELKLSAQRALLGNIPPTLRAVSVEARGSVIHFRAVFTSAATDADRESLSIAATEIIADFSNPFTLEEEFITLDQADAPHLRYTVFLRQEPKQVDGG